MKLSLPTQLALVSTVTAFPTARSTNSSRITWGPCNQTELTQWNATLPIGCANFQVPLDYSSSNDTRKLTLQLARVPAVVQPARGSILFNFGGPGGPGRSGLAALDAVLRNMTGGEYDLITFDPRGTVNTIPFLCVENDLEAQAMIQRLYYKANASDVQLGLSWANAEVDAAMCYARGNKTGSLIGTAFVARDLISVVDALGEDGKLRYWGLSYGTTLGATVAAMFPDRIDKLILDGVQNPHEYYNALADFEEWTDADEAFSAVFTFCVEAGPSACPLSALNLTATQLESAFWEILASLKYEPLVIGGLVFDYSFLKSYLTSLLYDNSGWLAFTNTLLIIFTGTLDEVSAQLPFTESPTLGIEQAKTVNALYGIHCGDRFPRTDNFTDMVGVYEELSSISRVFGDTIANREMRCARWELEAKERYEGDFQVQDINPILVIGNAGDAYTPIKSAYNVSFGFEGSVVLETDGYGHCSTSVPSSCTLQYVSQYWLEGALPENGTRCKVEAVPYRNVTWADVFRQVAGNATHVG